MKSLIILAVAAFSQFAAADMSSCNVSLPPGQSQIQILQTSQFVEHSPDRTHTVFSCGPFVNDGSVVITPATQIVELAQGDCSKSVYPTLTYIIYCN